MRGSSKPISEKPNIQPGGIFPVVNKLQENSCTFTGTAGAITHMSLETMAKLLDEVPKPMIKSVKVLPSNYLPEGTIVLSSDLAKAIEEAMEESDGS